MVKYANCYQMYNKLCLKCVEKTKKKFTTFPLIRTTILQTICKVQLLMSSTFHIIFDYFSALRGGFASKGLYLNPSLGLYLNPSLNNLFL